MDPDQRIVGETGVGERRRVQSLVAALGRDRLGQGGTRDLRLVRDVEGVVGGILPFREYEHVAVHRELGEAALVGVDRRSLELLFLAQAQALEHVAQLVPVAPTGAIVPTTRRRCQGERCDGNQKDSCALDAAERTAGASCPRRQPAI